MPVWSRNRSLDRPTAYRPLVVNAGIEHNATPGLAGRFLYSGFVQMDRVESIRNIN
jgi:hypothetical protein